MKILSILNDPPYGTERCYNALRLAHAVTDDGNSDNVNAGEILQRFSGAKVQH